MLWVLKRTVSLPDPVALLVTCLTADPGVANSILARSHTFAEIDRKIISMVILLPSTDLRRVDVTSESMCMKYWLTACPGKKCG